eukprot:665689-Rhodomonas_salina.1
MAFATVCIWLTATLVTDGSWVRTGASLSVRTVRDSSPELPSTMTSSSKRRPPEGPVVGFSSSSVTIAIRII